MRNKLSQEAMLLAWSFVKDNGWTLREGLRTAWKNIKLKTNMKKGIAGFSYRKVDGSVKVAFGTLDKSLTPDWRPGSRKRKINNAVQIYYDVETASWRSFRKTNLLITL
ncbi:MAG: SH3 beta-barrel fold-containing protein [Bacteroides sp.]|nr:SH3 beta-barrel fold-containing protein [Bacteroides sp.]